MLQSYVITFAELCFPMAETSIKGVVSSPQLAPQANARQFA